MLRNVEEMFDHAYRGYMEHAFPRDELRPLSCTGVDTLSKGGFYLTVIDALDSLVLLGRKEEFCIQTRRLSALLSFDLDMNVSVFETTIRVLGGLLAAHLLLEEGHLDDIPSCEEYDGELLVHAYDLGVRLLPAFDTETGIPYGTVNLRNGVPRGETVITSLAGGGTQLLEFTVLSRLSGDKRFEQAAKRAMRHLFQSRSTPLGLLGNHIDIMTGEWTHQDSGVGGNTDSFYEYLVKGYALLDEPEWLDMFHTCWSSIQKHVYKKPWFLEVHMTMGQVVWPVANSLGAFLPGMLYSFGSVKETRRTASESLRGFHSIWRRFGAIPEGFNVQTGAAYANQKAYPLRPELAESLWQAFRTTRDPVFLKMAADMVLSINKKMRTRCGFAVVENVETGELRDSMESFVLSETFKYLYLVFSLDVAGGSRPQGRDGVPASSGLARDINAGLWVLNTEGHPFPVTPLFSGLEDHKGSEAPPRTRWTPKGSTRCPQPTLWETICVDGFENPFE